MNLELIVEYPFNYYMECYLIIISFWSSCLLVFDHYQYDLWPIASSEKRAIG